MNAMENIRIAKPCPASWEEMSGDDQVRHCQKCKLNVFNLSGMTTLEARELIQNREGRTCVRFYQRADGKILTQDCPKGVAAVRMRLGRMIAVTAGLALFCIGLAKMDENVRPGQLARYKDKAREIEPIRKIIDFVSPPPTVVMGKMPVIMGEMP